MSLCTLKTQVIGSDDFVGDTSKISGIEVLDIGKSVPAILRHDTIEVFARDGFLLDSEEVYDQPDREVRILCESEASYTTLLEKFPPGFYGKIFFGNDRGMHREGLIHSYDYELHDSGRWLKEVTIHFKLQPFLYSPYPKHFIVEANGSIRNTGIETDRIKVTVTGTAGAIVDLVINSTPMTVQLGNTFVIDCGEMTMTTPTGTPVNHWRISGDFFKLRSGDNGISFGEGVSQLNIVFTERWLR